MVNPEHSFNIKKDADLQKNASIRPEISRRTFLKSGIGALSAPLLLNCLGKSPTESNSGPSLMARPGTPNIAPSLGLSQLGLESGRDGVMYVPEAYTPETQVPLLIGLHGAGGTAGNWASYYARAESRGMIFLAIDSRSGTWDIVRGSFGSDVKFMDRALQHVFDRCRIDPDRLALVGFSDGASYSLSLGVANGALFSHLIAYSPGFLRVTENVEPIATKPRVYISHGTNDTILSASITREMIVPGLKNSDYDVTFNEFDGGHEVPAAITESALDWFLGVG